MKRCLKCNATYAASMVGCPGCGFQPSLVDSFEAYAPEAAHGGGGFKASYFSDLAQLEDGNFWFRFRNKLILWALRKYCHDFRSFLEIGCGTGYVLSGIHGQFPNTALYGSELFTAGLVFAAKRLPGVRFMQADARQLPFHEEFDAVGAFDMLEHVEEDRRVLAQIHAALKPGGRLLLTVPQHPWLWSSIDEYSCHVRRYSAADLHHKIMAAGFRLLRSTSFVTTLLPAMLIARLNKSKLSDNKFNATAELRISPGLNSCFYWLLHAELETIRCGGNLPWGGSRLVIAAKI